MGSELRIVSGLKWLAYPSGGPFGNERRRNAGMKKKNVYFWFS